MGRYREKSVYMQYIYIAVGTGIVLAQRLERM